MSEKPSRKLQHLQRRLSVISQWETSRQFQIPASSYFTASLDPKDRLSDEEVPDDFLDI